MSKNNRLFAQFKYQLWEARKALAIFYSIEVAIVILVAVMFHINTHYFHGTLGGFDFAAYIFLFVAGCATFSQELDVCIQTGYTRKDLAKVMLPTFVGLAVIMLVLNYAVYGLGVLAIGKSSVSLIVNQIPDFKNLSVMSQVISQFAMLIFSSYLGYVIATIYCALNKIGRTIMLIILIGGTILGSPILLLLKVSMVEKFLLFIFGFTTGNLYITTITILVLSAICALVSYLVSLKVSVKA